MTYEEFIRNVLNTRGRFACGDEYHERHHIVPRCLGGGNEEENLIDLYAREHFIVHKLLALENPDNEKLVYAYSCMAFMKREDMDRYELTPEEYEEARIEFSKVISAQAKNRLQNPENHPMYSKHPSEETRKKIGKASSDRRHTKETREKMSEARKGEKNSFYGKKHSTESKEKMSEGAKIRFSDKNNHPKYGKHLLEETKLKISIANKEFFSNPENCPMYGKHHTEESKEKNRQAHLGKTSSEETRKKMSESRQGNKNPKYGKGKHVIQLSLDRDYIAEYVSASEAEKITGINRVSIRNCCIHKKYCKIAGGFMWIYKEEYEQLNNINGGNNENE